VTRPTPEMHEAVKRIGQIIEESFPSRQCVLIISPEYEGAMEDCMILTDVPTKAGLGALFKFALLVWEHIVEEREAQEKMH
jgi:hypothetical protein